MTGMMVFYRVPVGWSLLWLPALCLNTGPLAFAVGMALAVMGTFKRDFITAAPLLTRLWLLATPVAYPSNLLSEPWRTLYGLNPMAGVVEGSAGHCWAAVRRG
jgi:lipopolysaccharide transport system permease protein